jgi:hypothetical protein
MMAIDSQAEIAASVGALQNLGPGYDQALAEGLVERIGADIDKRIAAKLDERVTAEVDSRLLTQLDRYAGCRHQRRRAKRMLRAERRDKRAERPERQALVLPIASMAIALPITAIMLAGHPGIAAVMLLAFIWVIIGGINVAHALRKQPPR